MIAGCGELRKLPLLRVNISSSKQTRVSVCCYRHREDVYRLLSKPTKDIKKHRQETESAPSSESESELTTDRERDNET